MGDSACCSCRRRGIVLPVWERDTRKTLADKEGKLKDLQETLIRLRFKLKEQTGDSLETGVRPLRQAG
jgi:hypothetical protein